MDETLNRQKVLKGKSLVIYLAMLSAFPAFSTDLYLPALPMMKGVFGVNEATMNLTLVIFFISFSVMSLIWGPISDKYGRKPVLLIGAALYLASSALCAVSGDVAVLIIARGLQGAGGAATTAIGTAIVKDAYHAKRRERTLAVVQSMVVICPTLAPVFGAFLLAFTSWRGIFYVQSAFGVIVLVGAIVLVETIPEKMNLSIAQTMARLWVVLKNPPFAVLLVIFSAQNAAQMAFIGASSYIYQEVYGRSATEYSFFFAFNAICMITGPFIYVWLSKYFKRSTIIIVCLGICVLSGGAMLGLASFGPFVYAACTAPSFIATSAIKPPGMFLMLEQQKKDTGSASSLILSLGQVMGTIGIAVASLTVWDFAHLVGLLTFAVGIFTFSLYLGPGRKLTRGSD